MSCFAQRLHHEDLFNARPDVKSVSTICLVGANGRIGREVGRSLVSYGFRIRSTSLRGPSDWTHLADFIVSARDDLKQSIEVVDASSARPGGHDLDRTTQLADLCQRLRVPLLHIGSAAVLGSDDDRALDENSAVRPLTDYGRLKAEQERQILLRIEGGLTASILRVFNVIGGTEPKGFQPFDGFGRTLVTRWRAGDSSCRLHIEDPSIERDLVSAAAVGEVVAQCCVILAQRRREVPQILNVCSGKGWKLHDFLSSVGQQLQLDVDIVETGPLAEVGRVLGDPRLLRSVVTVPPSGDVSVLIDSLLQHRFG